MRRHNLAVALSCLLAVSSFAFGENEVLVSPIPAETKTPEVSEAILADCSAVKALKQLYGQLSCIKDQDEYQLTFAIPNNDLEKMLAVIVAEKWFPSTLAIFAKDESQIAISVKITKTQNDSYRHFRVLQKLCALGVLPWKTKSKFDDKQAYVTSIETNFGEDFVVKGTTKKSGLIFKTLTPKISRIGADLENLDSDRFASKKTFDKTKIFTRETYRDNDTGINGQPFFERGTYKEDEVNGRYMDFILRCQW